MNAAEIKALGQDVWGCQSGLLSVRELSILMHYATENVGDKFLEFGHYFGLSTCALVHALYNRVSTEWTLTSLDAHIADGWVGTPASIAAYEANRRAHFNDPRLTSVFERSETLTHLDYDFVFYDGDHGEEQLRFTRALIASDRPSLFIYDDSDFPFPLACTALLEGAGWLNLSPPVIRHGGDKTIPETQTLAVFAR